MNTPEKCPKCGANNGGVGWEFVYDCGSFIDKRGELNEDEKTCVKAQRDQLAERVGELEAWKESAMAVERQWDPNQLATMLGGKIGESQRAVIQWKVPILVQRVKRLEDAGDSMEDDIVRLKTILADLGARGTMGNQSMEAWAKAKAKP